ncbi:helix-turn-helix domain-containing protein [Natronomonas sp.]|uniref:helix-turn-helix domain-containing protein n=1 Tax=Natronomonas sp. TaxID=2184060 RepID=UPI002FC38921
MSVIAEFRVPSTDFELGRILTVDGDTTIELDRLVPIGDATVPLFWVHNSTRDSFVENVQNHPAVNKTSEVDVFEDRTLFTLDWQSTEDRLIQGIQEHEAQLLSAVGTPEIWEFELRFADYDVFTEFSTYCEEYDIPLDINYVYNATEPDAHPWYGLTDPQREAMTLAVRRGYYDIPRRCTTKELADELGISDQAVTERLRRAIVTLVSNTLITAESAE